MIVEIVFAGTEQVFQRKVQVNDGACVMDVIENSAILIELPDLNVNANNVGVFSRKVSLDYVLHENDRVEIYRPLTLTPNEIRKRRAARKKAAC